MPKIEVSLDDCSVYTHFIGMAFHAPVIVFLCFCNCIFQGVTITGFSPLGASSYSWLDTKVQRTVLEEPVLKAIADKHKKSTAQVRIFVLRIFF